MSKVEELRSLLENLSGTYSDFIEGTLFRAKKYDAYEKIINYIKTYPDSTPSDVIQYITEKILKIKPVL